VRERAERDSSAHAAAAPERHPPDSVRRNLLQAVTELDWLSPRAASLAALGRSPSRAVWSALRDDPGAVLLLLRLPFAKHYQEGRKPSFVALLDDPALPADALQHLKGIASAFVDWNDPALHPIYHAALTCARLAETLALRTGQVDADEAWSCGLLAPLGWFAVSAVAPAKAVACLTDPSLSHDTIETQLRHWGADHTAIARRLARRWNLPDWITALVGHLRLPEAQARTFGAEPALFHLTRLAIVLAREQGVDLGLSKAEWATESAAALGLSNSVALSNFPADLGQATAAVAWEAPHGQPLLHEVLTLAAENRRLHAVPLQQQLERELDELQLAFEEQVHAEAQRLQAAKLNALAEFAAGAGHEINNPLAVMSGQAQYLLNHESDWLSGDTEGKATKALQTIIAQTKRVHALLRDLMQFARPGPAKKTWFDLPMLLGEVAAGLEELALQRLVRIEVGRTPEQLPLFADAEQVRMALTCLLKNAIEAAPAEGWARLRIVEPLGDHRIEIAVEDSGSGPEPEQRDYLFDPFYCGRTAGRGRGLGLPIAWRLVRQQGGEVRLTPPHPQRPTCFVVALPRLNPPVAEPSNLARIGTAVEC
jgi:two-component system, NtrC family, sensor kinase